MLQNIVSQWLRHQARGKLMEALQQAGVEHPREELPKCDVVVLFGLREEAGGLVDRLSHVVTTKCSTYVEHIGTIDERTVAVAEAGAGAESAARAAEDIIALHQPRWLICSGFASALKPELRRGQIIMAHTLLDQHEKNLSTGMHVDATTAESTRGLHVGRLLTVDRPTSDPNEKQRLWQEYDALACDTQTMAVAEVCRGANTPILSVRAINEAVNDQNKPSVKGYKAQNTLAAKLGAATGAVIQKPSAVKDLWQVKEDSLRISDRLAGFLVGVIQQLPSDQTSSVLGEQD